MWDAARECKIRYSTILTIDRIDHYGRIWFTHSGAGPDNQSFIACYRQLLETKTGAAPFMSGGRVRTTSATRTAVTLEPDGRLWLVPVVLAGAPEAKLLLDTGATHTIVSPALAERIGLAVPVDAIRWPITVFGGHTIHVPFVRVSSVRVGDVEVEGLDVGVFDPATGTRRVNGVLGGNFLRHFTVVVDHARRRLTLDTKRD